MQVIIIILSICIIDKCSSHNKIFIQNKKMQNPHRRIHIHKPPTKQPQGETFSRGQLENIFDSNPIKIFPLDYYDEERGLTHNKTICLNKCGGRVDGFASYFSVAGRGRNLDSLVPVDIRTQMDNKSRRKSLSLTICNKIAHSTFQQPQPYPMQTNSKHTPYLQRKIHTARDKFHIKLSSKTSTSSIKRRKEPDIQIAHAIQLHRNNQGVDDSRVEGKLYRTHRSSQSKCRAQVMAGIKYGARKCTHEPVEVGKKEYLRPWSGAATGFLPYSEQENLIFTQRP